ncbi:helix-turn-helix transcriptional regulator, partial [Butyrivibrio proteoclasticus]|uniref:helix-turn-helix transcriptional regulator n=1 Tax=Butyrivibrio proteoclasticus TaxID=43305 RepID=UPI000558BBF2
MSIGYNIKSLREERKMTQDQVADSLGISFQAVSSWERDEYKPDTDKLIRLAELFDVSVSAIAEEKRKTFKTRDVIYD